MLIVAGAAIIWEQMSLSHFTDNITLKAFLNGLFISAEFYIPYKLFLFIRKYLSGKEKAINGMI